MNKGELVDLVAEKAGISKKQADSVISATVEAIMETVANGDKVTLVGFGSFEPRHRKAREGRNLRPTKKCKFQQPQCPHFLLVNSLRKWLPLNRSWLWSDKLKMCTEA